MNPIALQWLLWRLLCTHAHACVLSRGDGRGAMSGACCTSHVAHHTSPVTHHTSLLFPKHKHGVKTNHLRGLLHKYQKCSSHAAGCDVLSPPPPTPTPPPPPPVKGLGIIITITTTTATNPFPFSYSDSGTQPHRATIHLEARPFLRGLQGGCLL